MGHLLGDGLGVMGYGLWVVGDGLRVMGAECWVLVQHSLVFVGEDFDEFWLHGGPVFEDPFGSWASGELHVAFDQAAEKPGVFGYWFQVYGGGVAAFFGEVASFVENVGDASAHAGGEVAATLAEDDYQALGHVFAAMVAEALDDGGGAGVTDGEALAR
jgi:hypothetical protein